MLALQDRNLELQWVHVFQQGHRVEFLITQGYSIHFNPPYHVDAIHRLSLFQLIMDRELK